MKFEEIGQAEFTRSHKGKEMLHIVLDEKFKDVYVEDWHKLFGFGSRNNGYKIYGPTKEKQTKVGTRKS